MNLKIKWLLYILSASTKKFNALDKHRFYLIQAVIYINLIIFTFFTLFNLFITFNYHFLWIDLPLIVFSLLSLYILKVKQNVSLASTLMILSVFAGMVVILILDKDHHLTIMYMVFLPMLSIFLKGIRLGLIYSLIFSLIILSLIQNVSFPHLTAYYDLITITNVITIIIGVTALSLFYEIGRLEALSSLEAAYENEHNQRIKLYESQQQFKIIFDNLSYGLFIIDTRERSCFYANQALQRLMGLSILEMAQTSLQNAQTPIVFKELTKTLLHYIDNKVDIIQDLPVLRQDSSVFFADIDVSKEYRANNSTYIACFIRDVSNRHEMETLLIESHDRYQALFNQLPEAAWIVDPERGCVIDANNAAVRQYGYTKEELIDMPLSQIDAFEDDEAIKTRNIRIQKTGHEVFETRHRCKDGTILDVLVSVTTIKLLNRIILSATCLDISHQKEQAREIQRINQRYISLFENMPQPALVIDPESQSFVSINKAFIQTYGYTKKETRSMHLSDIYVKDHQQEIALQIKQIMKNGSLEYETRHRLKNDDIIHVIINARKIFFDTQMYLVYVITDVTKLKRIQEIAKIGSWEVDLQTEKIYWSDQIYQMYRFDKEHFSPTISNFLTYLSDEDRSKLTEVIKKSIQTKERASVVYTVNRSDSTQIIIQANCNVIFNDKGEPLRLVGTSMDITEHVKLKQINEELAMLFQNASSEIYILKYETNTYLYANKGALDNLGYTLEEFLEKSVYDINPGLTLEHIDEMKERIKGKNTITNMTTHCRKDGTTYPVQATIQRMTYGGEAAYVLFDTDVTELKKLQKELQELTYSLQEKVADEVQSNRQKDLIMHDQAKSAQMGEMLRMIAHQWRQPLNAISASAIELSLKNSLDSIDEESISEHADFIEVQTQNMSKTIDDFMNFFKPNQKRKNFTIQEVLAELKSLMGVLIKNKNIQIFCDDCEDISIYSYQKELVHIIINLISNASDAFDERHITPRAIHITSAEHRGFLHLSVLDNAGGIDPRLIDQIFDPYFTTKEPGKGTGIGLYMSKRIVEEILKGSISVTNEANGARFTIILPLK